MKHLSPSPPPAPSLCWCLSRLRMQVIFLPCHCLTALSYIYFIVPLWWLLRAFVSFWASVKNIYGFYSMLRDRPSTIIEVIQRCHIKAAFCETTGICGYFHAGGAVRVWWGEVHLWVELGERQENLWPGVSLPLQWQQDNIWGWHLSRIPSEADSFYLWLREDVVSF